ncbi:MAG: DegT/DnrJ/EryC1/StrS family aminotransferase, partial [Azospirillum sp.]|nr:DegT/DnrJ/EryC1/StrS family aminotransferase [Azospirillum sp.]
RPAGRKRVYHLYVIFAGRRDELLAYCLKRGIEAKIHYPIPLYLQDCLKHLGHRAGDFPVTDRHTREIITFPTDQHLSRAEQDYVIGTVREFYARG